MRVSLRSRPSAATKKKRMTKILIEEFLIECQRRPDSSTRRTEKKQPLNHHFGGILIVIEVLRKGGDHPG